MTDITARVLTEDQWPTYRGIRLAALQADPHAFAASYDEELRYDEREWRAGLRRADRLVAERDGQTLGVVSVGPSGGSARTADVFGLWVLPEVRNSGVAWRLVEAAADRAASNGFEQLYYWVSTQNGRAIGFATNFGFRGTSHRRTARTPSEEFGDQEIALVLPLAPDPSVGVSNPQGPRLQAQPGPAGDADARHAG